MIPETISQIVTEVPVNAIKTVGKDKVVEIVSRDVSGRISGITKCAVEKQGKKVLSAVMQSLSGPLGVGTFASSVANNIQTEQVRRAVKVVDKKIDDLSSEMKNVASKVDIISSKMSIVTNLSWLNAGLSLANLGVTVAGFLIVKQQLNSIESTVGTIQKLQEQNYKERYKRIQLDYGIIIDNIRLQRHIEDKTFEACIKEINIYISSVYELIENGTIPLEGGLEIIFSLIPMMINLIVTYIPQYYYNGGGLDSSLIKSSMDFLDNFTRNNFFNKLEDYYLLEKKEKLHYSEFAEIRNTMSLFLINQKLKVSDQRAITSWFSTEDDYNRFRKSVTEKAYSCVPPSIDGIPVRDAISKEEICLYYA